MKRIGVRFGQKQRELQQIWMISWRTRMELRAIFLKNGKEPKYSNHLRAFGELGFMAKGGKNRLKGKLENRGDIFFVGYAKEHAGDV